MIEGHGRLSADPRSPCPGPPGALPSPPGSRNRSTRSRSTACAPCARPWTCRSPLASACPRVDHAMAMGALDIPESRHRALRRRSHVARRAAAIAARRGSASPTARSDRWRCAPPSAGAGRRPTSWCRISPPPSTYPGAARLSVARLEPRPKPGFLRPAPPPAGLGIEAR